MSLTEIARFADLTEAQIAASRLRADGLPVLVQNEHWGAANFTMGIAMGGFRLWVPDSEAEDARALIAHLRAGRAPADLDDPPPTASAGWRGVARTIAALFLAVTFGWLAGWLVARTGPASHPMIAIGAALAAVLCGAWGLLLVAGWLAFAWN